MKFIENQWFFNNFALWEAKNLIKQIVVQQFRPLGSPKTCKTNVFSTLFVDNIIKPLLVQRFSFFSRNYCFFNIFRGQPYKTIAKSMISRLAIQKSYIFIAFLGFVRLAKSKKHTYSLAFWAFLGFRHILNQKFEIRPDLEFLIRNYQKA